MNQVRNDLPASASQLFEFPNTFRLPFSGFSSYITVFTHPVSAIKNTVGQRTRLPQGYYKSLGITGACT